MRKMHAQKVGENIFLQTSRKDFKRRQKLTKHFFKLDQLLYHRAYRTNSNAIKLHRSSAADFAPFPARYFFVGRRGRGSSRAGLRGVWLLFLLLLSCCCCCTVA